MRIFLYQRKYFNLQKKIKTLYCKMEIMIQSLKRDVKMKKKAAVLSVLLMLSAILISSCNFDEYGHAEKLKATNNSKGSVTLTFVDLDGDIVGIEDQLYPISVEGTSYPTKNQIGANKTGTILITAFQYPLTAHKLRIQAEGSYFRGYDHVFENLKMDGTDHIYLNPNMAWIDVTAESGKTFNNVYGEFSFKGETKTEQPRYSTFHYDSNTYNTLSDGDTKHIPVLFETESKAAVEVTIYADDTSKGTVSIAPGETKGITLIENGIQ